MTDAGTFLCSPVAEEPVVTPTTIPVTITPEAAARVAALGMQAGLEQMLEHTRQTVPDLRAVQAEEAPPYDSGDESGVTIWAVRPVPLVEYDTTDDEWGAWKVDTFPPDVCRYFVMMSRYGASHAG